MTASDVEGLVEKAIVAQQAELLARHDLDAGQLPIWPDDWDATGQATYRAAMRAALLAILPDAVAGKWQDISTAPKDGRHVYVARHMGDFGWVLGVSYWEDVKGISGWISKGVGLFGELGLGNPTHWMPLPSPPDATAIRTPPASKESRG